MTVTIAAVDPLPYADEIKELFVAHARPEFPEFFDRAYPPAFADGATSWVGRDPSGRVVMHIACFPRRFTFGGRRVVAGLMANLMVATPYRAFFPALKLLLCLIQDSKARGVIDFLYADPNEESRALLRGTRFVGIGTLQRYVLPLRGRRGLDLGVKLFHALLRAAAGMPRLTRLVTSPAEQIPIERLALPAAQPSSLIPQHDETLYTNRLPGYPGKQDWWFTSPDVAVFVRGPDPSGLAVLYVARWASGVAPWSYLPDLIAELRRRGCERLQITTLAESDLAQTLKRSGFIPRNDAVPLFAYALTPLGAECVQSVKGWEITDLDCDR